MLFVGAIKQRKGIIEAIKALEYYKNNFSNNFIYNIIGDYNENDSYYKKITQKIRECGLENEVIFRGKVSEKELENYYKSADLFLMLPINNGKAFEGFGLVYLEANAKGVPCVGSKNCGAEEAISNNKTGYTADLKNCEEVAKKIDFILNKNYINKEDCIKWAMEHDINIKAREIIDYYDQSQDV